MLTVFIHHASPLAWWMSLSIPSLGQWVEKQDPGHSRCVWMEHEFTSMEKRELKIEIHINWHFCLVQHMRAIWVRWKNYQACVFRSLRGSALLH